MPSKRGAELKRGQNTAAVLGVEAAGNEPADLRIGVARDSRGHAETRTQGSLHRASMIQLMLALFLAVSGLALNAQVKGENTSMELGSVTIWLGMTKQELVRRCAKADYMVVTKTGDNHVMIVDG